MASSLVGMSKSYSYRMMYSQVSGEDGGSGLDRCLGALTEPLLQQSWVRTTSPRSTYMQIRNCRPICLHCNCKVFCSARLILLLRMLTARSLAIYRPFLCYASLHNTHKEPTTNLQGTRGKLLLTLTGGWALRPWSSSLCQSMI